MLKSDRDHAHEFAEAIALVDSPYTYSEVIIYLRCKLCPWTESHTCSMREYADSLDFFKPIGVG